MVSIEQLQNKETKVCVVGLGYVGLPLAVLLAKHFSLVGFDISERRVEELKSGKDHTHEVNESELVSAHIEYSCDPNIIKQAQFIIVAVPTPIDEYKNPDLSPVEKATTTVGKNLAPGSIVVYESTVYPGVTEDICVPILEKESGLKYGTDFKVGYSPERVNPGDKEHTIDHIIKVVSGMDDESCKVIAGVYGSITKTFKAASIKVAEGAKAIENTQRDINIALMNELAILFNRMGISIYDVLEAAGTKWNFLKFTPGLVGGHCIGVDPYYLTYKAKALGHHTEVILAGRGINDTMHKYIAHQIVKHMVRMGKDMETSNIVIFGLTFKENIPDIRNSKVAELFFELKDFGLNPIVYDPHANPVDVEKEYGIKLTKKEDLPKADTLVIAVAHDEFKDMSIDTLKTYLNHEKLLVCDIKHLYNKKEVEKQGISYWSL
ncbi:MAG: nucleotide sugar dehydrogenase [Candidatus Magasanikbacteria bacterium]